MERSIEKLRQLPPNFSDKYKDLMIECDMLQGNINRMMCTDDAEELLRMFAIHLILGQTNLYLVTPLLSFEEPSYFICNEESCGQQGMPESFIV